MALRDWPIQQKLTAMLVLISGLVLLLTSAAFAGYQYWSLRSATRDAVAVRGRIIAANSTASLAFANDADAREILSALRTDQHIVAAVLYDKSGHVFAAYPAGAGAGRLSLRARAVDRLPAGGGIGESAARDVVPRVRSRGHLRHLPALRRDRPGRHGRCSAGRVLPVAGSSGNDLGADSRAGRDRQGRVHPAG